MDLAVTPMFLAHVDCTGCHIQPRPLQHKPTGASMVTAASPKACDRCHKPGLGDQLIPLWQQNTKDLYQAVSDLLTEAEKAKYTDRNALAKVTEAGTVLELVRLDGSWGVHNPRYTEDLLTRARKLLGEAAKIANPTKSESPAKTETPE